MSTSTSSRFRAWLAAGATAVLALSGSACSSLLYHPTFHRHYLPETVDLAPEEVWIRDSANPAAEQEPLHAWYFHARAPRGIVVFFHGNAENLSSHFQTLRSLPSNGFDYVIFDYRGFGKSRFAEDRSPTPESTVRDGMAVLRWVEAKARIASLPWVLFGQSLGGNVALRAIEETKLEPRAVILDSTFLSYRSAGASVLARTVIFWPLQWLAHLVLSDEWAPHSDALASLPGSYPFLVIHGDADPVVPFEQGLEVYRHLRGPKVLWRVIDGVHTDALWGHEWRYRDRFLDVLGQAVGGRQAPRPPTELPPGIRVDSTWVYRLPYRTGTKVAVLQGTAGGFSHRGVSEFAIDFDLPEGTDVLAMRDGEVVGVEDRYGRGGPNDAFVAAANYVRVRHEDGSVAEYVHLLRDSVKVRAGDRVREGDLLGRSGESGFATRPHLHVSVYLPEPGFPGVPQHSVPIQFDSAEGPAVRPEAGESFTAVDAGTYPHDFLMMKR